MLRSALLDPVPHGFSTRAGSTPAAVLPGAEAVRLEQVHSARVVTVDRPPAQPPRADAVVSSRSGLVLCIVTADCAPVLLADHEAGVIGAAHAGWRGAVDGVLEQTVAAMKALGASPARIRAAIGPTIAQPSYEVDAAFRERFAREDRSFFVSGRPGHWQFDLPAYVAHRLRAAKVERIEDLAQDTYAQPERFFSFRRATHRGEPTGGRQISLIGLR